MDGTTDRLLILFDKDDDWLEFASSCLIENGYSTRATNSLQGLENILKDADPGTTIVFLDEESLGGGLTEAQSVLTRNGGYHFLVLYDLEFSKRDDHERMTHDAFKLGAIDYIGKPYGPDELLTAAKSLTSEIRLEERETTTPKAGKQGSILVVEDNSDWLDSIMGYLPKEGVEVARDYNSARDKIKSKTYNLVISDWLLNESDIKNLEGISLLQDIRSKDSPNSNTPVIVVTAYGTYSDIRRAYKKWKICHFFSKENVNPLLFLASVSEALGVTASV